MDRVGYVYNHGNFAGIIKESDMGYEFIYDSEYMSKYSPVGFNFPFSSSTYYSRELFPLFENLTSEGWLLEIQSSHQNIDRSDSFGILLRNGGDMIGSLTVLRERI